MCDRGSKEWLANLIKSFSKYENIIEVLVDHKNIDGICDITQKQIASILSIHQTLVSKCLIRLERSDECVVKIAPGKYLVNHTDLVRYGPLSKVLKYLNYMTEDISILEKGFIERAELLDMSVDEIKMINAYLSSYY